MKTIAYDDDHHHHYSFHTCSWRAYRDGMQRSLVTWCVVTALSCTLWACSDDDSSSTEGAGGDMNQQVSLTNDVMPIVVQYCGGCHTRTDPPFPDAVANMAYLEEKGDILGLVGTVIVAGDSANSGFIGVLRQEFGVGMGPTLMPPPMAGPAVPAADVDTIALWIDEGAQDN